MSLLLGARVGACAPIPPKSARGSTPRARSARRRRNILTAWHENNAAVILPQDVTSSLENPFGLGRSAAPPCRPSSPLPPQQLSGSNSAPARVFKPTPLTAVKARTDSDVTDDEVGAMRRMLAAEAKAQRESESRARSRANAELRRRLRDVGGRTHHRLGAPPNTVAGRGQSAATAGGNGAAEGAATAEGAAKSELGELRDLLARRQHQHRAPASRPPAAEVGRLGGNVYYGCGFTATDSLRKLDDGQSHSVADTLRRRMAEDAVYARHTGRPAWDGHSLRYVPASLKGSVAVTAERWAEDALAYRAGLALQRVCTNSDPPRHVALIESERRKVRTEVTVERDRVVLSVTDRLQALGEKHKGAGGRAGRGGAGGGGGGRERGHGGKPQPHTEGAPPAADGSERAPSARALSSSRRAVRRLLGSPDGKVDELLSGVISQARERVQRSQRPQQQQRQPATERPALAPAPSSKSSSKATRPSKAQAEAPSDGGEAADEASLPLEQEAKQKVTRAEAAAPAPHRESIGSAPWLAAAPDVALAPALAMASQTGTPGPALAPAPAPAPAPVPVLVQSV